MTPTKLYPICRSKGRVRQRCGFTLIHMLTVIAMMSILLTMTGVIFQFLLRSDQSVSRQSVLELTILELSRQFRDDVHSASNSQFAPSINEEASSDLLELSGPTPESSRVRYRVATESLVREVLKGDAVARREVYRLPECEILFASEPIDAKARSQFLVLSIDRAGLTMMPQQRSVQGHRNLTVVAELGRAARLLASLSAEDAIGPTGAKESSQQVDDSGEVTP